MNKTVTRRLENLLDSVGDMALKRRARALIMGLDPQSGERILDLGCGDGFYLHLLSNLGLKLELVGSDYEQTSLDAAKRNLKHKIPLVVGDLMKKLPFAANSFDGIIMSEVAEHLPDDVKGLKEAYRVLKPDGRLMISVPNANYPLFWDPVNWVLERTNRTHIKDGFWAGLWFNHIRLYTVNQIVEVCKKAGFRIEDAKAVTWWCLPFNHHIVNMVARLLWGGRLPKDIANSFNKYEIKVKREGLVKLMFDIVNGIDKLNDLYQPDKSGVGIVASTKKAH